MNQENQRLNYLLSTLWTHRLWWIAPAVLGLVLASTYALFLRSESWTARQSFLVRDDLLGQAYKPGRFESQESMKSAQETILEVSRRPQVIRAALTQLGPEPGAAASEDWVTDELIESMQGSIEISAPNGAEFGKTEVIVLTSKASTRERSRKFIELLSSEIVTQVNRVRGLRFQSMEAELLEARDSSKRQLDASTKQLQALDALLGPDVGVMNALNDSQAGDTPMKREILQIKIESRQLETQLEMAQTTLGALKDVKENPKSVIHLSSDVLRQQPALNRYKDELVRLQSALSIELAAKHEKHAGSKRARLAVQMMEKQILDSIQGEINGVESSITMQQNQLQRLNGEVAKLNQRLITLSSKRADHLRLSAEIKELTSTANKAQASLSQIQSLAKSTRDAGLITPVDAPQVGTRPDGAGRKIVAAAGGIGGLMVGLGLVLLVAPPMEPSPVRPNTPEPSSTPGGNRDASPVRVDHRPVGTPAFANMSQSASAIESAAAAMTAAASAMQSAAEIPRTHSLSDALKKTHTANSGQNKRASTVSNQKKDPSTEGKKPAGPASQSHASAPVRHAVPASKPSLAQKTPPTKAPTTKTPPTKAPATAARAPEVKPGEEFKSMPTGVVDDAFSQGFQTRIQTATSAAASIPFTSTLPGVPQAGTPSPDAQSPLKPTVAPVAEARLPIGQTTQPKPAMPPQSLVPPTRSQTRPVDLVKSAEHSSSFIRNQAVTANEKNSPSTMGKPGPIDGGRQSKPTTQIPFVPPVPIPDSKDEPTTAAQRPRNPFLDDRAQKPTVGKPASSVTPTSQEPTGKQVPEEPCHRASFADLRKTAPASPAELTHEEVEAARRGENDGPVKPDLDKIRKLTSSISHFVQRDENQ